MEKDFIEDDVNPKNPSTVRIAITQASFSEDDDEEKPRVRSDSDSSIDEKEMEKLMQENGSNENEQLQNGRVGSSREHGDMRTAEDDEVSKAFENGVSLRESSENRVSVDESVESIDSHNGINGDSLPAMEVIGDRVLIERDGKFELVDVSEIKAEYYDMLGLSAETNGHSENTTSEETPSELLEDNVEYRKDEKPETKPRPKTTSLHDFHRRKEQKRTNRDLNRTRTQSAKALRKQNDEYSYVKSVYAMTEQQLEIRRKCREAKLRRQKEGQEREREEQQRKREDADRAFQAWLYAKIEAAREARANQLDPDVDKERKEARQKDAQSAYSEWLHTKRKQDKAVREMEDRRKADEAAQYAIRDRQLCDEAFRSWLKKKKKEENAKNAAKKKKKPKLKRKEQPPLNSPKNRYYEYYGYRNNVVL